MTQPISPLRIPQEAKDRLKIMFIAKHALGDGTLHPEDGNHAVYHHEVRTILEGLGINLVLANKYEALFENPGVDFVFPLLNRGGFLNSEMMLPLLCTRLGIPYLGASPILRGLSDDKHLTKLEAKARGIPTAPWAIYRRGAPVREADCPMAERMVIKPNASSASWGVGDAGDWAGVRAAVAGIHDQGHDAIVEPFLNGSDVEVPVITVNDEPAVMPMMMFRQADPTHLRTYWEKRDLVDRTQKYELFAFEDKEWQPKIDALTRKMVEVFRPFDYGRYEFRLDEEKGEVQMLEVNLNCNLWSQKVYGRSAVLAGLTQEQLIETILCESLARHGLIERDAIA
ncbi:phosphoribosylglycinamide synthetase [Sphingomonas cavernae]|uniref:Phosphoribosylglycinamide synthetase n=1 Tax=Sphingomonas cavernae TaxID=2320861 RepID=A0A418WN99_9SPHN|nr:phosphoribosylglycinamide synthetase [Sphingomonas cavernae]RJF91483.1 phosphoribosylglycinamide synthetase [Sphingomonas cavernae]